MASIDERVDRYTEAISARLNGATDRWQGGFVPAVSADTTSAEEAARAAVDVADQEQSALRAKVARVEALRDEWEAERQFAEDHLVLDGTGAFTSAFILGRAARDLTGALTEENP